MHIPEAVGALERDLRGIFGNRLQSIVVYGLRAHAASAHAHDDGHGAHQQERLLTHTLAIVDVLSTDDLSACAVRVSDWHDGGLATPLLVAAHEFDQSLDAFPFEFGAILSDHVVVSGRNPFDGLQVKRSDLRRACEVQARGHLLHLREGYLETRGRSDALAVLIVRSAAAFAALLTSVAYLDAVESGDLGAAARHVERQLQLTSTTASEVAALASVREISSDEADRLFPPYLDAVERLVAYIDRWTRA